VHPAAQLLCRVGFPFVLGRDARDEIEVFDQRASIGRVDVGKSLDRR